MGSGYIGVEIAGILNAMGTKCTLLCRGSGVLRHGFDPLITDVLNAEIVRAGIELKSNSAEVASLTRAGGEGGADDGAGPPSAAIDVTLSDGQKLSGFDCVLYAVGRRPVTDSLGLETTGARPHPRPRPRPRAHPRPQVHPLPRARPWPCPRPRAHPCPSRLSGDCGV